MEIQYELSEYRTVSVIGEGRYATVFEGVSKRGEKVAIKILSKNIINDANPNFTKNELNVYRKLERMTKKSECLLKFYDYYEFDDNHFFVLEFIDGHTLQRVIFESFLRIKSDSLKYKEQKKASNIEKQSYLLQIGAGLQYLHANKIYHCDLKPENILVYPSSDSTTDKIKIIDFGCSKISDSTDIATSLLKFSGTPGYSTPEVYTDDSVNLKDVDTWAYACTLYYCFTGKHPFVRDTIYLSIENLRKINVSYDSVHEDIQEICQTVFKRENRSGLNQIIADIEKLKIDETF